MMVIMIHVTIAMMPICYNDIDIYVIQMMITMMPICNNDIDIYVMLQRVTNYFGTLLPDVIPGLTIYNILTDCSPVQISSTSSSPSITQSLIFNMISIVQPCKSSRALFFFLFAKFISELNNVELNMQSLHPESNVLFSPE